MWEVIKTKRDKLVQLGAPSGRLLSICWKGSKPFNSHSNPLALRGEGAATAGTNRNLNNSRDSCTIYSNTFWLCAMCFGDVLFG